MGGKAHLNATDSPKVEVGEIDTRAPFESVKAAVSLFGEGTVAAVKTSVQKPKSIPTERTLAMETQLLMAEKELNKFKDQLKNAETTKAQALDDLIKAKGTVEDLTNRLYIMNESKESATKATEAAWDQIRQLEGANSGNPSKNGGIWKEELDGARQQYATAVNELNAAKQELQKVRQDIEAYLGDKAVTLKKAVDAEHASVANKERADELLKEITSVQESLVHVKLTSEQALQEQVVILSEKDTEQQATRLALHETEEKLELLKKEFDPDVVRNLEEKLAETSAEIAALQKQMEDTRASDQDSIKEVTAELDGAQLQLTKLAEEEISLRTLVESLKGELEIVKKEHTELKEKEAEAENIAGNLHIKLQKNKAELEAALAEENKARAAVNELSSTLQQLSSESKNARIEIETMKKDAGELKMEAEMTRIALEEAEKKLQVALKEAEEATVSETSAVDQIRILSEKADAARASTSESGAQITISAEEYESLSRKVEESNMLAEMKVAAAVAQVEAVKASENEALKRLETAQKETEQTLEATQEAFKRAEMAEKAKMAVEGEIRRWREREQKRATEAATPIRSETEMPKVTPTVRRATSEKVAPSPMGHRILTPIASGKADRSNKMQKSSTIKKMFLNDLRLSGIFQRKKSQVEGASPSCPPGEKPM